MKRVARVIGMLTLLASILSLVNSIGAQGGSSTVKEIMGKLYKGQNPPLIMLKKDLQATPPAWDGIQKLTKDFAASGTVLSSKEPPKGDKTSWAKLTQGYAETTRNLDAAAQKKDKDGALAAHAKLKDSCNACHDAHRK